MFETETEFRYDVFLSHSAKDKDVVRDLANRLKSDGVRVWFDEWEIKPGDSIPAKIEDGLEHSRVLVPCMSAEALAADWPQLESHTFRFKDPLNHNRRLIPLRLDDAPTKGSLAQFSYIDWRSDKREEEYPKLLEACRSTPINGVKTRVATQDVHLECNADTVDFAFSEDGHQVIAGGNGCEFRLWEVPTGRTIRVFEGHDDTVECVAWNSDASLVASGSSDATVRLWDFGGQADQRLIHQLYMDQTQVAALVFDPQKDGAEIFKSFTQRHVEFWMDQKFPVILVIRNSKGKIRWMEIRDHLKKGHQQRQEAGPAD
jgi:hypothetical protein